MPIPSLGAAKRGGALGALTQKPIAHCDAVVAVNFGVSIEKSLMPPFPATVAADTNATVTKAVAHRRGHHCHGARAVRIAIQ